MMRYTEPYPPGIVSSATQDLARHLASQVPAHVGVVMVEYLEVRYETVNAEHVERISATWDAVQEWLNR